ncbi:histidine phosphatase family protein [Mycobacterium sp. E1747]|uniref:histidine phosphatase family protein n=1 Tax=Mycobacterium sp. E1747 TaxID=1834128 RepID=UPI0008013B8E|nr:histidine phosphatase family protein [Mycobacterium sp. E1747]OBH14459.1 histidine phosphatase [Mycobacterium sp. E1747]
MTGVLRLTLVSHAMTDAMAAGRFPLDEPLSDVGRRQVNEVGFNAMKHLAAPERRAGETAELLGLAARVEPRLADIDCGTWCGRAPTAIDPRDLHAWLTDPQRAPHGGESIVALIERVAGWLKSVNRPTVAVTHPAVIRAAILIALAAPPESFWRIDIPPVSRIVMHLRDGRWTLRL